MDAAAGPASWPVMRHALVPLLALLISACSASGPPRADGMLAIGDSVMAWNGEAGIPEVTARELGLPVRDAAASGAALVQGSAGRAALGLDIRAQWAANRGRWAWVLVDGGANDLRPACGTAAAPAALDRIIGPRGGGALPALLADIRATGSRAAVVGYYDGLAGAATGFTPCQPLFDEMNRRLARLAARDPGLAFLDAGDVIDPTVRGHYARDRVHPSAEGSRRIGTALAARMR